jgi:hypothetical protein
MVLDMKTRVIELQQELEIARRRARIDAECATDPRYAFMFVCEVMDAVHVCCMFSFLNIFFLSPRFQSSHYAHETPSTQETWWPRTRTHMYPFAAQLTDVIFPTRFHGTDSKASVPFMVRVAHVRPPGHHQPSDGALPRSPHVHSSASIPQHTLRTSR